MRQALDSGYDVRCLVRPRQNPADFLRDWGAKTVSGNLAQPKSLPAALVGVHTVVDVSTARPEESIREVALSHLQRLVLPHMKEVKLCCGPILPTDARNHFRREPAIFPARRSLVGTDVWLAPSDRPPPPGPHPGMRTWSVPRSASQYKCGRFPNAVLQNHNIQIKCNPVNVRILLLQVDWEGKKALIQCSKAMGIQRYIFFSIVGCDKSPEVPLMNIKYCTEQYLQQVFCNPPLSFLTITTSRAPITTKMMTSSPARLQNKGRWSLVGKGLCRSVAARIAGQPWRVCVVFCCWGTLCLAIRWTTP